MFNQDLVQSHAEAITYTEEGAFSVEIHLEALFEQWLSLECLSDAVKIHLKQMQAGVLSLAIEDETFLTHHQHPVRQALRALVEHCYLYTLSCETTLLAKVEYKIHQLALRFLQGNLQTSLTKPHYWINICEEVFAFLKSLKTTESAFNERYMTRLEKGNLSWQKNKEEGNIWVRHTWQNVTCPVIWQFFLVETVPFLLTAATRGEYAKEILQTIHAHCFSGHPTPKKAQTWLPLLKAMRGLLLEAGYNAYVLSHFFILLEDHLFFNTETAKATTVFTISQIPTHAPLAIVRQTQQDEFEHVLKKVVGMQGLTTKR